MAFTGTTNWEVRSAGDDTNNGGGFDSGVAGFPTDGAATSATGTAPVFSSASYTFVAGDVGAKIYIKSGTNWTAGWYPIASVSAGAATLNAAIGAAVLAAGSLSTVAGCATTASPTSATWGIDYSQQAGAQIAFTDMVIDATTNTKFTSAAFPVGKNYIGNIISVTSGTGFTVQRVAIVSTVTTVATCDKSLGTLSSTGGTGKLGGAFASPGLASAFPVAGNVIFVLAATYTITSATTNIAAGCLSPVTAVKLVGYTSNRTVLNTDARPTLILGAGVSTANILGSNAFLAYNLILDGNAQTVSRAGLSSGVLIRCKVQNFTNGAGGMAFYCEATGCTTNAAFQGSCFFCVAHGNTVSGFSGVASYCVSYGNTGASTDGFTVGSLNVGSVAYGNGRHGFNSGSSTAVMIANCIAEGNAGWGYLYANDGAKAIYNCAHYNNTSGGVSFATLPKMEFGTVALGATPFTAAASQDFRLNAAAAGLLCRAAGFPSDWSSLSLAAGLDYLDIGAFQHQDAGGGGMLFIPNLDGV